MKWSYQYASPNQVHVVARLPGGDEERTVTLELGQRCVVQPLLPTNHRNQGRTCMIRYFKNARATVEFDSGRGHRFVRVPLYDLVPQDGQQSIQDGGLAAGQSQHGRGFHGPDTHTGDDTAENGTPIQA